VRLELAKVEKLAAVAPTRTAFRREFLSAQDQTPQTAPLYPVMEEGMKAALANLPTIPA
jgi:hypothetical protein